MPTMMKIAIALIVLGLLLCAIGIATGVLGRRRRKPRRPAAESLGSGDQTPSNPKLNTAPAVNIENAASTSQPRAAGGAGGAAAAKRQRRDEHGRLVFIQEGRTRFEIEDLLRASAEVLGSGTFGSSYKATLCEGPAVVVKRFKDMNGVGREDFSEHMRRLGRLAHPNLLPLVAYLYKKEEKLVTDYIVNGSLAQLLHGTLHIALHRIACDLNYLLQADSLIDRSMWLQVTEGRCWIGGSGCGSSRARRGGWRTSTTSCRC